MKNLTILTALLFTFAFSVQAQKANTSGRVLPSTHNSFKIIYTKSGDSNVKIKLRDAEGAIIHIDKVESNDGFMKRYDLSQLNSGTYSFEVLDKSGKSIHEVNVSDETGTAMIAGYTDMSSVTIVSEQSKTVKPEKLVSSLTH
ncbi:MAG: hypothetical protein JXR10_05615 [Cyclobacteriaceae bacterium]